MFGIKKLYFDRKKLFQKTNAKFESRFHAIVALFSRFESIKLFRKKNHFRKKLILERMRALILSKWNPTELTGMGILTLIIVLELN